VDAGRRGGGEALQAYERLLKAIADAKEAAGGGGANWVRSPEQQPHMRAIPLATERAGIIALGLARPRCRL
jgi:hypothetical protein